MGRWLRMLAVPAAVSVAVAVAACSLDETRPIEEDTRTPSTPSDTALVPGASAPGPSPSASPTASPDPPETPSETPTAGPCGLPQSNPESPVCTSDPGHLFDAVDAAITRVTQRRPNLFDFADKVCDTCYKVRDVGGYYAAVRSELAARGICSLSDTEELGAKDSNDSSEQFDILLASGHIRRGWGMYRGICYPAIF